MLETMGLSGVLSLCSFGIEFWGPIELFVTILPVLMDLYNLMRNSVDS